MYIIIYIELIFNKINKKLMFYITNFRKYFILLL